MDQRIEELKQLPSFVAPPKRVISLVPSITESLFVLGAGHSLVGITEFCIEPADQLKNIQKVGGPKDASLSLIQQLKPDLVLANQEENSKELIEGLVNAGITTWLMFPTTVRESIDDLYDMIRLFPSQDGLLKVRTLDSVMHMMEMSLDEERLTRYFCPIWSGDLNGQPYWMTFNRNTYPSDLLRLCGGDNSFKDRERRYPLQADLGWVEAEMPGERDQRYPCVTLDEIIQADPEMILLPDEPYEFTAPDVSFLMDQLKLTSAVKNKNIFRIDGRLLFWHGTRTGIALAELPNLFVN